MKTLITRAGPGNQDHLHGQSGPRSTPLPHRRVVRTHLRRGPLQRLAASVAISRWYVANAHACRLCQRFAVKRSDVNQFRSVWVRPSIRRPDLNPAKNPPIVPAPGFSKRGQLFKNASFTVPVGPLRCLAMMTSATPGSLHWSLCNVVTVNEHDDDGVLLDGAGFAQVTSWALVGGAPTLRLSCDSAITGHCSSRANILSPREISPSSVARLSEPLEPAHRRVHESSDQPQLAAGAPGDAHWHSSLVVRPGVSSMGTVRKRIAPPRARRGYRHRSVCRCAGALVDAPNGAYDPAPPTARRPFPWKTPPPEDLRTRPHARQC